MHRLFFIVAIAFSLAACGRNETPTPATAMPTASASASTTVGGVTLSTSTVAIADLNDAVATRYGIDPSQDGLLLLVTVRDAAGNGIDPGDLQLSASASVLPDPMKPLELRSIQTEGMTDYIGMLHAKAPASVQYKLSATRDGARADIASNAQLYPR